MNLNSIVADRSSAPQASPAPNGGGESFQLAYAKVYDGRYALGTTYVAPERALPAPPDAVRPANATHTVHAGDTLTAIARARLATLGVAPGGVALRESVAQIAKANNIRNPDRIYTGQKLDLATLDTAFGRNQAAAAPAPVANALRETVSPPGTGERFAADFERPPQALWHQEDRMPADDVQIAASAPAQLPLATPPFPLDAARAEVYTQIAPLPPIDPMAAHQLALYAQNAAAAPEKTAEPARALPDIVYKGVAGKVLDALPIEPSTRVALQRANSIVSGAFTARSLGALTGFGGPLLTVAGLIWGIFSSRQIEAAPATEAKVVPEPDPVADTRRTAQTKVADALN